MSGRLLSAIEQRIVWTRFARETDKAVLRALARWYAWRADGSHVRPTSIDALATKSGVPKRSVDRALARLIHDGFLQVTATQNRGASTYQIVLDRLATADPDDVVIVERQSGARPATSDASNARVARETAFERQSGARTESGAREIRPDFEKVARPYRSEEVVGEEICTPPPTPVRARHSGAQDGDVAAFAAWWTATYPAHHEGLPNPIDATRDGAVLGELFDAYTIEQLQVMSQLLWRIVADNNPHSDRSWIAASDRGLRVLRRKAAFLAQALMLRVPEQLTFGPMAPLTAREIEEAQSIRNRCYGGWCPHDPKCADGKECVRTIALGRRVS